ncbi:phage tail fiber protein [Sporosarcina sp. FSL K6-3457]|uniref:phage tail fiber protein n=1 Tax=Sporosarcina sp. FSL K6-3457 TaxID=2978204 RepID=UPI0030F5C59D
MSNLSKYLEMKILSSEFAGSFLALYRSNPGEDDSGVEVGSAGYQRQSIGFSYPSAVGGKATISNAAPIEFPAIAGGYESVTHAGVRDAQYGGNLLAYKALTTPIESSGGGIKIETGALKVSLD